MKAAQVKISIPLLKTALGIPEKAIVSGIFQDRDDMVRGSLTIVLHGVGPEMSEGSEVRIVTLAELQAQEAPPLIVGPPEPAPPAPREPDKFNKRGR
jgi:hypothetical protein